MKNVVSWAVLVATLATAAPSLAQQAPSPVRPSPGGPQVQPPRPAPGNSRPQVQPPRPGNGGPQVRPPRPGNGGPQIQPPRPGGGYRPAPPGYRPGYWNDRRYYYPSGYRYRPYAVGAYLPRAFWGSRYWWVNDWQTWGLSSYRPGYRWVRVGADALLVSTSNGRIIAVRRGVFW